MHRYRGLGVQCIILGYTIQPTHTPSSYPKTEHMGLPILAPWEVAPSLPFPPMPSAFIHHTFPEHPHVLPTNAETGGNGDKKILALMELTF